MKAKTKKAATQRDVGNLPFAQAMHGKHNLTHDPRPKRQRTRAAAKRAAVREW